MKKIFTLLFLVFATLTAMAQEKTITVTNVMTTTDGSSAQPLTREDQTVVLTKNADGTWDLTMKDLAAPTFTIGDITFKGVNVEDQGYSVYYITANNIPGTVTSKSSKYNGAELYLQINGTAELSENGAGAQTIDFELFNLDDDEFYLKGLFAPASEEEPEEIVQTYFMGKSGDASCPGIAELYLYADQETGEITKLGVAGLADVSTTIGYGLINIEGVGFTMDETDGSITLKNTDETTAATEEGDPFTVKSFDINIKPDYGTGDSDLDDGDLGDEDPDVTPGLDSQFIVSGTIVIADPTTGADVTYTLSTDESILTAIKSVKNDSNAASGIFSVDGMKLDKIQKGLNIVRMNGKTVKIIK